MGENKRMTFEKNSSVKVVGKQTWIRNSSHEVVGETFNKEQGFSNFILTVPLILGKRGCRHFCIWVTSVGS